MKVDPATQTIRLRVEKRTRGKRVTVVSGLDSLGNVLPTLAARLKTRCGSGGTVKEGEIELQGEHLDAAEEFLRELGYRTKRK